MVAVYCEFRRGSRDGEEDQLLPDERDSESSLSAYLQVIRRWGWAIVLCAVAAPLVAVLLAVRKPVSYQASAQVLIRLENLAFALQHVNDPTTYDPIRTMDTEAQLARTPDVARRALAAAGIHDFPSYLLGSSTVTEQTNSDILTFSVTNASQSRSILLTNAYAAQFAKYRNALENSTIQNSLRSIQEQLNVLAASGEAHSAQYQSLVSAAAQLQTMRLLQTSRAVVVRRATGAARLASSPTRAAILGGLLGLALGVAAAFLAEALDRRVRSEDRIRSVLGLPLLGRVNRPSTRLQRLNRLASLDLKDDPQAEAYRLIAMNLKLARLKSPAKKIMVTSALPGEGKSTTAANLAVVLAQSGERVALLDLDLRSPSMHLALGVEQAPGITDVVIGRADIEEALIQVDVGPNVGQRLLRFHSGVPSGSLRVLPAGSHSSNMSEAIPLEALGALLEGVASRTDVVLIDSPPLLVSGAALGLTEHVDGVLLITRLRVLRTNALHDLKRALDSIPAAQLGFVVAGASPRAGYGSSHLYGFSHPLSKQPESAQREEGQAARLPEGAKAVREVR